MTAPEPGYVTRLAGVRASPCERWSRGCGAMEKDRRYWCPPCLVRALSVAENRLAMAEAERDEERAKIAGRGE